MGLFDQDQDNEQEAAPDGDESGGLLSGITPRAPSAAVAPTNDAPAPGWQGGVAGLFDKLEEGVKAHVGAIGDNLMPVPTALKGLLSPDDISTARRQGLLHLGIAMSQGRGENPLQSLGRGLEAAQHAYGDHLDGVIAQRKEADAEQQRQMLIAQQQQLLKSRAQIAMQFPAKQNETAAQTLSRFQQIAAAQADAGDLTSAAKTGALIKDLRGPAAPAPHTINAGDKMITIGPDGKVLRTDPVGENPAQVARDAAASARANSMEGRQAAMEARAEAAAKKATTLQQNVIVKDFNKTAEDYHAAESGYAVLKAAKASPNNFMQPMAALDALARMLNPKGAVRQGTLQILKSQGSLGDRLTRNLTMLQSGKWPDGMQKEVFDMADKIMSEHTEDFETARQEAIDRGDAQGVDVRELLHKSKTITNTSSAPSGNGVRQFLKK
jgi:hypothetical protein